VLESKQAKKTIMAAINTQSITEEAFKVRIYEWNEPMKNFNSSQNIYAYHPTAVHLFEPKSVGVATAFTYMFVAEGEVGHLMNKPLLRVYKISTELRSQFMEIQQIRETQEVLNIESVVTPENDLFVFTLMRDSTIKIYKLRGASGFVYFDTIYGRGATSMQVVSTYNDPHNYGHFIALGYNDVDGGRSSREGHTKVLTAKVASHPRG